MAEIINFEDIQIKNEAMKAHVKACKDFLTHQDDPALARICLYFALFIEREHQRAFTQLVKKQRGEENV